MGAIRGTLQVRNFAQIRQARIEFGDLTVLVGPQGVGKSLLLQLWKLALDQAEILTQLNNAGYGAETRREFLELYLGEGLADAWSPKTVVKVDGARFIPLQGYRHRSRLVGRVFYIPAHRALLLAQGWPAPFSGLNQEIPAVARLFSHNLNQSFSDPHDYGLLFPWRGNLRADFRKAVDEAIFHGGKVLVSRKQLRKRLELKYGRNRMPFMTWTAGQREFAPLLLALLHLLPPGGGRAPGIEWVVLEEPEMGLHPQAISVAMIFALEMLSRGYRVVVSTHAPLVLDLVFAMTRLQESPLRRKAALLLRAFKLPNNKATWPVMNEALDKSYRTYALSFDERGTATTTDISRLDPSAANPSEAGWGGLTSFSGDFNSVVAEAVGARKQEAGARGVSAAKFAAIQPVEGVHPDRSTSSVG